MKKESKEFENFDATMRKLMSVPHTQIKEVLDAEKREKQQRKAKKKPSAEDRDADKTD